MYVPLLLDRIDRRRDAALLFLQYDVPSAAKSAAVPHFARDRPRLDRKRFRNRL
jgi:hypothetical protein